MNRTRGLTNDVIIFILCSVPYEDKRYSTLSSLVVSLTIHKNRDKNKHRLDN